MLGTVQRAGNVLDLFTQDEPEWGVTQVANDLGVAKSQAHELLVTLANVGLLQRTAGGRYRLGWRVIALSSVLLRTSDFKGEAARVMREIVGCFGETVHLAAWDRDRVIYIDKAEGTKSVRIASSAIGSRLPGHGSGVGKLLLAARPWDEVVALIDDQGLEQFTTNTIVTLDGLRDELERVRTRGFAHDQEEVIPEISCVAAPIFDAAGGVVAAMSISVPTYRFQPRQDDFTRAIVAAAGRVSRTLRHLNFMRDHGHEPPPAWVQSRSERAMTLPQTQERP